MNKKFFVTALLVLAAVLPAGSAFAQTSSVTGTVGLNPAACLQLSSNLYIGAHDASTNGQVTALQNFLNARYGNQLVTGYFGTMTFSNVVRLQRELGVSAVGGVGPLTRAALIRLCNSGTPSVNTGLTAQPTSGTSPLNVAFTATVPDANQYIINFGDGTNSGPFTGGSAVSHAYTIAGTYTATLSQYIACAYATPIHCMIAVQNIGQATITVTTPVQQNGFTVTSPTAGQVYTRGTDMTIGWSGLIHQTFAAEQDASIIDLYTAAGVKVGTIAIANGISGTYNWHIPAYPQNYMCTMQYPNGLCGINIQGQYYIQVTDVVGSGFDANSTVIGTAQSGIFTVNL
jgi:PKD repeat protein